MGSSKVTRLGHQKGLRSGMNGQLEQFDWVYDPEELNPELDQDIDPELKGLREEFLEMQEASKGCY